jgi:starch-binding outer membrane protein, SusD/RagB family
MKILNKSFIILVLLAIFSACSEDILDEHPPHIIAADNLYVDVSGFETGLNGLYAQFRRERGGETLGSANDLLIDPAVTGTDNMYGNERSGWARDGNDWGARSTPTNAHYRRFWNWLYATINGANTIIDRAENPDIEWSDEDKNRVIGEAKLIRAWAYRHATFMWGDVPLTLSESSGTLIKTDWERAPVADVRAQMVEDLLFAEQHLPETSSNGGKVVKGVATHYLAELYLTMGDPAKAKEKAESLINGGVFSLITERYGVKANEGGTPFSDMFLDGNSNKHEGNTEALWVMQHQLETIGGGDNVMRRWHRQRSHEVKVDGKTGYIIFSVANGGRGLARVAPTRFALEAYEPGDDRGGPYSMRTFEVLNNTDKIPEGWAVGDTAWLDYQGKDEKQKNNQWPSTRKWDWANPLDLAGARQYNDQVYLRLGETYLLLAEAQLALGDAGGAAATINVLRDRANANPVSAGDIDIDFILDERSRELFSEEHRRYTLLRYGKWFERTQKHNVVAGGNITDRDKLFPIPQDVIDANLTKEMRQNPGY